VRARVAHRAAGRPAGARACGNATAVRPSLYVTMPRPPCVSLNHCTTPRKGLRKAFCYCWRCPFAAWQHNGAKPDAATRVAGRGAGGGGDGGADRGGVAVGTAAGRGRRGACQPAQRRHVARGAGLRAAGRGCAQRTQGPGLPPETTGGQRAGNIGRGRGGGQRAAAGDCAHRARGERWRCVCPRRARRGHAAAPRHAVHAAALPRVARAVVHARGRCG